MTLKEIKSERIGDKYYTGNHDSGLRIFIYPKDGHHSTYAILGTKFGSINTSFFSTNNGEVVKLPDGIAHYLEHKLFESEDGDAFSKYAKTGASANAYTSFDMTCYLFSCTENFEESLKILLEFVQSPYFTPETVKKEQGIISQEIKMYDDDPSWRVMFNLYRAMFHKHPVKVEIAGTVQSISEINPENLYECYSNFYNLNNMALCVAGKVDPQEVLKIVDKIIKPINGTVPESYFPDDPYDIVRPRVEEKFPVSMPIFQLGFKEDASKGRPDIEESTQTDVILQVLASKASPLYRELLDQDLINESFGYEYFEGKGYAAVIFSGESKDPDKTASIIKEAIKKIHKDGISKEDFENAKKALYGRTLSILNSAENISNAILTLEFSNRELFAAIESVASVNLEDVNERLKSQLDIENCALSIISPESK
ncbi:MAG: hypothetical protein RUMPE_00173 [Eubacteriales bacterium SKADARSKE-1]|nr:hypothetical protein [Eubacteriales bacterium SKADARSKE-1]